MSENGAASARRTAAKVLRALRARYPGTGSHLAHGNPWELLVAVVLSAQCTDARVNMVTPRFFARWATPDMLALADQAEVEDVIHSTGFFRQKAKNLIAAARIIVERHGGEVPRSMQELVALPGVARKCANIILFGGFGLNEGIAVDTHVKRIAYRLGLTEQTDPVAIEKDLMPLFPREEWGNVNHRLVWFGRDVCKARRPDCANCDMAGFCPRREPPQNTRRRA